MVIEKKVAIIPARDGDINGRDYESIINGSLILKPDISYLETWPNLFIKDETYIPFQWDLEDLNAKRLVDILKNNERRITIVNNAQSLYKSHISDSGMRNFCNRFISIIEK